MPPHRALDLNGVTESAGSAGKSIEYGAGSRGAVRSSRFQAAPLRLLSGEVTVEGNTFITADPVYTTPPLVPRLVTNTFAAADTSTIHIVTTPGQEVGVLDQDVVWKPMGTATRYRLDDDVNVVAGKRLEIGPDVELYTGNRPNNDDDFDLQGNGTVLMTGAGDQLHQGPPA